MFGIIVLIVIVIYIVRMSITNSIDDGYGRIRYKDEHLNTYINHNGLKRDLTTNEYRYVTTDYKGDVHLKGKSIGDLNISQQDREKEYLRLKHSLENGINIGRTTIYWMPSPDYDPSKAINILGKRYKDIKTGEVLVVREHEYQNFYVTVDTMEVIRYTDSQRRIMKQHNSYSEEKERKDIVEFQTYINEQRTNPNYIGDPTKGIGIIKVTQLEDYWKPMRGV